MSEDRRPMEQITIQLFDTIPPTPPANAIGKLTELIARNEHLIFLVGSNEHIRFLRTYASDDHWRGMQGGVVKHADAKTLLRQANYHIHSKYNAGSKIGNTGRSPNADIWISPKRRISSNDS